MTDNKLGLWLIGARGGVSVSTILGLSALQRGLIDQTGLVTASPEFDQLPLPTWSQLVVGGHEIRDCSLAEEAMRLHRESRVFSADAITACQEDLNATDRRIQPGTLWRVGDTIRRLASDAVVVQEGAPREILQRLQDDLHTFKEENDLADVIVVNLASTEAPLAESLWPNTWEQTEALLDSGDFPLPASSLYAIAALDLGLPYVNFTPSLGATPPGIGELAKLRGTCHAGRDGKTGETLLKSVLAPMFAARNLNVMSWVGHNIFGNMDGQVLDDPINKAAKVRSKDHLLADILGYAPQTLVTIEHIQSMKDWKTAWDHIHFQGFFGTPMTMQFTWQGCDSMLAAPLVIDLARLTFAARTRGETGPLSCLSSFFKSPIAQGKQGFFEQLQLLQDWVASFD